MSYSDYMDYQKESVRDKKTYAIFGAAMEVPSADYADYRRLDN